jgi:hypothetical protein
MVELKRQQQRRHVWMMPVRSFTGEMRSKQWRSTARLGMPPTIPSDS